MRSGRGLGQLIASLATGLMLLVGSTGCAASPPTLTAGDPTPASSPVTSASSPLISASAPVTSAPAVDPASGLRWVSQGELPPEAVQTLRVIRSGGPYPYDRDGVTFENREGLLPARPIGYYREFTVATPGSGDRGARRIVVGDNGEAYYTGDHYDSFYRIRQ